jgi:hypothetical protein
MLDGTEWPTSRFGHFTPETEPRYALYRRLGGPPESDRTILRGEKYFRSPDFPFFLSYSLYPLHHSKTEGSENRILIISPDGGDTKLRNINIEKLLNFLLPDIIRIIKRRG